jgi:WD40 repeat protein
MATAVCASGQPGEWISCDDAGAVALVDWAGGGATQQWAGHSKPVTGVAAAAWLDGAISASRDATVQIWRRGTHSEPTASLVGHDLTVSALAVSSAQAGRIFSGSRDSTVRLWDVATSVCLSKSYISRNVVTCAAWVKGDSTCVWQGSEDLRLRLWDVRAMAKPTATLEGYTCFPLCIAASEHTCVTGSNGFSGDGKGGGCELRVWDRRALRQNALFTAHTTAVTAVALLPGAQMASASRDGTLNLWQGAASGVRVMDTARLGSAVTCLCPANEGEPKARLYAATADGTVRAFSAGASGLRQLCMAEPPASEDPPA